MRRFPGLAELGICLQVYNNSYEDEDRVGCQMSWDAM